MELDIMLGKVQGKRRGRQKIRWIDDVTKETSKSLRELCEVTQDRKGWREYIDGVTITWRSLNGT